MYLRGVKRKAMDGAELLYYQLAESVYDKVKRQARVQVVHNFGRADEVDPEIFRRLAASLLKVCGPPADPGVASERVFDLGLIHVVDALWEKLGIGQALRHCMASEKQGHPFDRILMALTAYRLEDPSSKLGCYEYWLPERVWLPESRAWKLEEFYRALDFYLDHADTLEGELLGRHGDFFGAKLDLVFADLSLLRIETGEGAEVAPSFASAHQRESGAHARFWVGLAVSREGVPLRSWVFPEETRRLDAMVRMERDLRAWGLERIVFIGESAEAGEAQGFSRIRAVPLRGGREVKDAVLARPGRYRPMGENLEIKEVVVDSGGGRKRYVLCRNPEEARRRGEWRAWVLQLLEAELQALDPSEAEYPARVRELRTSRLFGAYLRENRAKRLLMDPIRIAREARMDGKCVLSADDDTLSAEDVALSDQGARVAEEFFRQVKAMGLRPRPMFHWSPRRIEAHIRLCSLYHFVQRFAELRTGSPWEHLLRVMESCKAVQFRVGDREYVQQTLLGEELGAVMRRLQVPLHARLG